MRAVQHVFRRGAVYWWRRRLPKKTGESELAPIALSLRTRELSKARIIAAHLVVASDGILRQERRNVLSSVQVRAMLESVARTHLAKLDRLAALETADGISADEGRASDRTMGWAKRLQASQGITATVGDAERRILTANGLAPDEIEQVSLTLDLLRQNSNGTFPRQKLIALLEAVETGFKKEIVSPFAMKKRGIALPAGIAGGNDWQFLVLHVDEFADVFGCCSVVCHAHSNKLADKADPSGGERGIVGHLVPGNG